MWTGKKKTRRKNLSKRLNENKRHYPITERELTPLPLFPREPSPQALFTGYVIKFQVLRLFRKMR